MTDNQKRSCQRLTTTHKIGSYMIKTNYKSNLRSHNEMRQVIDHVYLNFFGNANKVSSISKYFNHSSVLRQSMYQSQTDLKFLRQIEPNLADTLTLNHSSYLLPQNIDDDSSPTKHFFLGRQQPREDFSSKSNNCEEN